MTRKQSGFSIYYTQTFTRHQIDDKKRRKRAIYIKIHEKYQNEKKNENKDIKDI